MPKVALNAGVVRFLHELNVHLLQALKTKGLLADDELKHIIISSAVEASEANPADAERIEALRRYYTLASRVIDQDELDAIYCESSKRAVVPQL